MKDPKSKISGHGFDHDAGNINVLHTDTQPLDTKFKKSLNAHD